MRWHFEQQPDGGSARLRQGALVGVDRFLVPEGHTGAARYFTGSLFVAHNLRERCGRWLALRTPHAPPMIRLLQAASTAEPLSRSSAENSITLVNAALECMPPELRRQSPLSDPDRLSPVVRIGRDGSNRGRLMAFFFEHRGDRPVGVLKLRQQGGQSAPFASERAALQSIASLPDASMRSTAPRPLLHWQLGTGEALLISPVGGCSAYVEMQGLLAPRRRVEAHFRAAAVWLSRLHLITRVSGSCFDLAGAPEVTAALRLCRDAGLETAWYDEFVQLLAESPLPLAASHGDFWPGNLHLDKNQAGDTLPILIDWEGFQEAAPPNKDLFHFPLSYGLNYPWSRYRRRPAEKAFRLTFIENTPVSRATSTYLRHYCITTGLDPRLLRPLLMLFLLGTFSQGLTSGRRRCATNMASILAGQSRGWPFHDRRHGTMEEGDDR